jgi:hypothetical protein
MKVAILGAGPTAAFIARACLDCGIRPDVFAAKRVHPIGGAFWIYEVPESIAPFVSDKQPIYISKIGTAEGYAQKMWGDPTLKTSFSSIEEVSWGYSPEEVLPLLWGDLSYEEEYLKSDEQVALLARSYDLVFQTFPTKKSLDQQGTWREPFFIINHRVWSGQINEVTYDGDLFSPYLRASYLFGWRSVELRERVELLNPYEKGVSGWKLHPGTPRWTTAPAKNVILLGRFAQWDRKLLSHQAYRTTRQNLALFSNVFGTVNTSSTST